MRAGEIDAMKPSSLASAASDRTLWLTRATCRPTAIFSDVALREMARHLSHDIQGRVLAAIPGVAANVALQRFPPSPSSPRLVQCVRRTRAAVDLETRAVGCGY